MDRKNDQRSGANLEEVNAELRKSLEHCRALLADCRKKLAANSDDLDGAEPGADEERSRA